MSERADSEPRSRFEESPSGLDINPRPPRPARVSRRAAGAVIVVAVIILGLFAYGGYKRQERQVAALAERGAPRSVAPATAARRRNRQGGPGRNPTGGSCRERETGRPG